MIQNIFFQYLEWHFIEMPRDILKAWKNYLKFNLNYWSLPLLIKTFFSHWRRYNFSYGRGLDLKRYLEAFHFNLISRVLGAIVRSFFIVIALLIEFFIVLLGLIIFLLWIFLPFILFLGLWEGFKILF